MVIDVETRSSLNLKKTGAPRYAEHPSTQVMTAAFVDDDGSNPRVWVNPLFRKYTTRQCVDELPMRQPMWAHNVSFDGLFLDPVNPNYANWHDTEALCLAAALPAKLEHVADVLKLPVQKDMVGHAITLNISKGGPITTEKFEKLIDYNIDDVRTTACLLQTLKPLGWAEHELFATHLRINARGILVDTELLQALHTFALRGKEDAGTTLVEKTNGAVQPSDMTRVAYIKKWLAVKKGVRVSSLNKQAVDDLLADPFIDEQVEAVLHARQSFSKSSLAKFDAIRERMSSDCRLRQQLKYHAARPGRWGGRGVQLQNLPRPTKGLDQGKLVQAALDWDYDLFKQLSKGKPLLGAASCLRGTLVPSPGKAFFVGDYASIEARIVLWFAKCKLGLQQYREGRDLYLEMAAKIFGGSPKDYSKDSFERSLGKEATLGCGFGMGHVRFRDTCATKGIIVTEELARRAVNAYRTTYFEVQQFWNRMQSWWQEGKGAFTDTGRYRQCTLPSGRKITYWDVARESSWNTNAQGQWVENRIHGPLLTENVTQAAARDVMAAAIMRIEAAGFKVVLTVHDEIIAEGDPSWDVKEFERLMSIVPDWLVGCPIAVEAWKGMRYKK